MTLTDSIQRELDRLASEWTEGETRPLHLQTGQGRLACEITAADALACSMDAVVFSTERTADAPVDRLEQIAEALRARMTYLMEPLEVIEVDEPLRTVQVRSRPPHRADGSIRYYELEIRPGRCCLRRYEKRPQRSREAVPITLTREVFRRLVDDLCLVVS